MIHPIEKLLAHVANKIDAEASTKLKRDLQKIRDVPMLLRFAKTYDDVHTAGPLLHRALQLEPKNEAALAMLASVLVSYHRVREAEVVIRRLRRLYPQNVGGVRAALDLLSPSEYFLQVESLARALKQLEPSTCYGTLYLAKILAARGQRDEALAEVTTALSRDDIDEFDRKRLRKLEEQIQKGTVFARGGASWP
jgi:thioredoxin-like negative regulator of GroEL